MTSWMQRLRSVARHNRPSRKPQLWEDPWLALRRRVTFEVNRWTDDGWLDRPQVIELSPIGFGGDHQVPPCMEVAPREMINRTLFLYGTFEISETRLIQALLRPGMTFLDVGANIGYYSVIGARLVGPEGKVHSFEPHPGIREKLQENIERNGYRNVVVHREAVAATTGSVAFFASEDVENQGTSSIVPGGGRTASHPVSSITLDDFAASLQLGRIDLIKMDIEGAELQAISGGSKTLAAPDAPPIIFEAAELGPVADALRAFGYQIKRHHYTLARGLELLDPDAVFDDIFRDYEAPNYFAAKNDATFRAAIDASNAIRPALSRVLGRI